MRARSSVALFCAASSPEVGAGHIARCLALAKAFGPNWTPCFKLEPAGRELWQRRLDEHGIKVIEPWGVETIRPEAVILDDYRLDAQAITAWRARARARAFVMFDDFGGGATVADLTIAPGLPATKVARVLAGPAYAVLDAEYSRPPKTRTFGRVQRLLISCGRQDSADVTGFVIDALATLPDASRPETITVVLGRAAPHYRSIIERAGTLGAEIVEEAPPLCPLYDNSDLVIGAGGVSLFERMARARASVTIVTADNQRAQSHAMSERGATLLAGDILKRETGPLAEAIVALSNDGKRRRIMGEVGRGLVDGLGASRVAAKIEELVLARAGGA